MKHWIDGMISRIGLLIFNLVLTIATRELITFVQKIVPSHSQEWQLFGSSLSIYEKIGCFIFCLCEVFSKQNLNYFHPNNEIQFIKIFENFLQKQT